MTRIAARKKGKRLEEFEHMTGAAKANNVFWHIYNILKDADMPLSASQIQGRWPERYNRCKPGTTCIGQRLSVADWTIQHGSMNKGYTYTLAPHASAQEQS